MEYYEAWKICKKLHSLILKYKDCDYDAFLENINSELGTKFKFRNLQEYAKYELGQNPGLGQDMILILNYVLAKKRNDEDLIKKMKQDVDRISQPLGCDIRKNLKRSIDNKSEEIKKRNFEIFDKYLNGEVETISVYQYNFLDRHIDEYGYDKFIELYSKMRNLEPMTMSELMNFQEMLKYFVHHLEKNIELFEKLDLSNPNDIVKVKNLYVTSEEKLNANYTQLITNLYTWKIHKMKNELKYYSILLQMIDELILTKDFSCINRIENSNTLFKRHTDEITYEYYLLLIKYMTQFDRIKSLSTVSDKTIDNLSSLFTKKMLLEDK